MKNILFPCLLLIAINAISQNKLNTISAGFPVNYNEDSVGTYTLPDPLQLSNGKFINNKTDWEKLQRPKLLQLFEEIEYGRMPAHPKDLHFTVFDKGTKAFHDSAIRKQVTVYFTKDTLHKMDLLIYLPVNANGPVPLLLNISFAANNQIADDAGVRTGFIWTKDGQKILADKPSVFGKMNIQQFIAAGFGFATVYYGDIEPDCKGCIEKGIRGYYLNPDQQYPADDEWGAVSAWAWGLSCAMDYFETDKQIDADRIALQGASRLGKTVLWAGVHDTRFKMVIASISGEGGAAIARRKYGEEIKHITDTSRYFYQFAGNYHSYSHKVNELPFDAHMLVALMAPRPLLLQTGDSDYWSDPKGEFLSAVAAEPVYHLYGLKGPGTSTWPVAKDTSLLMRPLGYYMHSGGHTVLPDDWRLFIQYMQKFL